MVMVPDGLWYGYEGRLWSWYQMGHGMTMKVGYGHGTRWDAHD